MEFFFLAPGSRFIVDYLFTVVMFSKLTANTELVNTEPISQVLILRFQVYKEILAQRRIHK